MTEPDQSPSKSRRRSVGCLFLSISIAWGSSAVSCNRATEKGPGPKSADVPSSTTSGAVETSRFLHKEKGGGSVTLADEINLLSIKDGDNAADTILHQMGTAAKSSGRSKVDVLAEVFRNPKLSDSSLSALQKAWIDNPQEFAEAAWKGLSGARRSKAISGFANDLMARADAGGLENFYKAVPPGTERVGVSGKLASLIAGTAFKQGVRQAEGFDFPEERREGYTSLAIQLRQAPGPDYQIKLEILLTAAAKDNFQAQCRLLSRPR